MNKRDFTAAIEALPVYDAHTHLVGDSLPAKDVWEIVHYFWFLRELIAAGYPAEPMELPEAERRERFAAAYALTAGTGMNYSVRRIFADI